MFAPQEKMRSLALHAALDLLPKGCQQHLGSNIFNFGCKWFYIKMYSPQQYYMLTTTRPFFRRKYNTVISKLKSQKSWKDWTKTTFRSFRKSFRSKTNIIHFCSKHSQIEPIEVRKEIHSKKINRIDCANILVTHNEHLMWYQHVN